ncbi:DUF1572 family protein [Euzebyella saccharophila]|uniref:DUF1572 family protein n=1 Tax=Euzebyella saccharophila TaxID=679664 RepID=A0ABV8JM60_9FLAO|nr:DUF1572 family protein [Euzebyella saccharophila]
MDFTTNYLKSSKFEFQRYKILGDRSFEQLTFEQIRWQPSVHDNSIALIVKHMVGNMLSRWTNFLKEDGEKSWRHRENEFQAPYENRREFLAAWEEGWSCLFNALDSVNTENFDAPVFIRSEHHTITEAINRQLAHYANHVGQIVYLSKMIKGEDWISPSIPKGGSIEFNKKKFGS